MVTGDIHGDRPRRARWAGRVSAAGLVLAVLPLLSCSSVLFLNPSFVNQSTGGVYPLTPGEQAGFVLARANNTTTVAVEFVITAERRVASPDTPDTFVIEKQTFHVLTQPQSQANDLGVLIDCPVVRVGLGENLDHPTTEPGVFVGAETVGAGGFGVPPNANPLNADFGNFSCGDTLVFVVSERAGVAGGVVVSTFVLDSDTQPTEFQGLDTFVNARTLIEEQSQDDEE